MTLIDTSVWIEHFRNKKSHFSQFLLTEIVSTHEFVLGELSLGVMNERNKIFERLESLDCLQTSSHAEVLQFSKKFELQGQGIGWIDAHLLHACYQHKTKLFTLDKKLMKIANRLL